MSASPYEIPVWECRELLGGHDVGRLCVVDGDYPLAFPINYRLMPGVSWERIVFRASSSSAIGRSVGPASLEIDEIDGEGRNAWSIIVRGDLHRVHGRHDLPDPHPLVAEGRHQYMVLDVVAISGRRFRSAPSMDGFAVEWQTVD